MKLWIILIIGLCILPLAQASLLSFKEKNPDAIDSVFKELKVNDAKQRIGIFTMDNSGRSGRLSVEFNEVCGKVMSYQIYKQDNDKQWKALAGPDPGQADYMIQAEIQPGLCEFPDGQSMGYQIDWQPVLHQENLIYDTKIVQDKWAWWNATTSNITNVQVASISGYGHSYDNWTLTYSIDFNNTQQIWNTTWFNTTSKQPVAIYPFNINGTVIDVANGHNGTNTGAVWTSAGHYGGGYIFRNTNTYINTTILWNGAAMTNFTYMGWINSNNLTALNVLVGGYPGARTFYLYLAATNGKVSFAYYNLTNASKSLSCTTAHTTGEWVHAALTYDGSAFNMYDDGSFCGQLNVTTGISPYSNPIFIGRAYMGSNYYSNSTIDDVRLFNYPLTSDEILMQFQNNTNKIDASSMAIGENWQGNVVATDGTSYSGIFRSPSFSNSYTCTQPAINTNWLVDLNEGCTMPSNTDLGRGNLTLVSPLSPQWLNLGGNLSFNQMIVCPGCNISLKSHNRIVAGQK